MAHAKRYGKLTCLTAVMLQASCGSPLPGGNPDGGNGNEPLRCDVGEAIGETTVSYSSDIVPIFQARGCLTSGCHGGGLPSFNYSLDTYEGVFGPGDSATALGICNVVPGEPDASFLVEKISSDTPRAGVRMPRDRPPLSDTEIELIRTWIAEGAAEN